MSGIWSFVIQIGLFILNQVIKDMQERERLKQGFLDWVAQRGPIARQTVELYNNLREQSADLDEKQKQMEQEAKKP